jgi:hypothetical protein
MRGCADGGLPAAVARVINGPGSGVLSRRGKTVGPGLVE